MGIWREFLSCDSEHSIDCGTLFVRFKYCDVGEEPIFHYSWILYGRKP
jgi:hypothetical protein